MEDPESHYVRGERHKLLRKAIHQLPPVYREVIQLRQAKEGSCARLRNLLASLFRRSSQDCHVQRSRSAHL